MKRLFCICIVATIFSIPAFADPHHHHHHHWHGRPYGYYHHHSSSGLETAADIVGLVGVSIATLRTVTAPQVIATPVVPVAPQPVIVTPAPQQVIYTQPPVQQTVIQEVKPRPRTVTINPDGTKIIQY